MNDIVLVEKNQGVALITLNRPDAMNALSQELRKAISAAFIDIQADADIRVAILTGHGRAFCAGFDLKELAGGGDAQSEGHSVDQIAENDMASAISAFTGPIIAAVNGYAITGGFELALACDMILASTEACFADTHARVGILPGWGLSQRLPRLIGLARAKEIAFTGNKITAAQAYEWGLVNRVLEPDQLLPAAKALAKDMTSCVPSILQQYKGLIDTGYNMSMEEALAYEARVGIASAQAASASMINERKDGVFKRGREQGKKS